MDKRNVIITDEQIVAVQRAWFRDYGEKLTREEARRKASIVKRAILARERRQWAAKKV